ncbi:MAG: hypothetical protein ACOCW6_11425 [Spirochaetota bacterium]
MSRTRSKKSPLKGSPANRQKQREEKVERAKRRKRLRIIRGSLIAAAVLAVGAGVLFSLNMREERFRDLSLVGTGVPAVVQVHDITCPVCTELKRDVERISGDYSDRELLIRTADVDTEEGLAFAARYTAARRATLLFIDGDGELVDEHTGALTPADLRMLFDRHAAE